MAGAGVDAKSGTAGVWRSGSGCWLATVCECKAVATTSHSAEKAGKRGSFGEWGGWPRRLGPSGGNGAFRVMGASAADRETGGVEVGREVAWGRGKEGTCATIAEGVDGVKGAPADDGGADGVEAGREVAWGRGTLGTCATIAEGVDSVMGAPAADGGADGTCMAEREVAWGRGKEGTCATIAEGVDGVMGAPAADGGADGTYMAVVVLIGGNDHFVLVQLGFRDDDGRFFGEPPPFCRHGDCALSNRLADVVDDTPLDDALAFPQPFLFVLKLGAPYLKFGLGPGYLGDVRHRRQCHT